MKRQMGWLCAGACLAVLPLGTRAWAQTSTAPSAAAPDDVSKISGQVLTFRQLGALSLTPAQLTDIRQRLVRLGAAEESYTAARNAALTPVANELKRIHTALLTGAAVAPADQAAVDAASTPLKPQSDALRKLRKDTIDAIRQELNRPQADAVRVDVGIDPQRGGPGGFGPGGPGGGFGGPGAGGPGAGGGGFNGGPGGAGGGFGGQGGGFGGPGGGGGFGGPGAGFNGGGPGGQGAAQNGAPTIPGGAPAGPGGFGALGPGGPVAPGAPGGGQGGGGFGGQGGGQGGGFGGPGRSPAQFIGRMVDRMRAMPQDQYDQSKDRISSMAARMSGADPNSPQFAQTQADFLAQLEQLRAMPDDQYQQNRDTLLSDLTKKFAPAAGAPGGPGGGNGGPGGQGGFGGGPGFGGFGASAQTGLDTEAVRKFFLQPEVLTFLMARTAK